MVENHPIYHWLLTASGPADWLILLVCIYELRQNRVVDQTVDGQARRRNWPWVLAAVLATVVAWGPITLSYFGESFMAVTHAPGHLTDDEKWRLGKRMRNFNEYILTVVYYSDRAKVAEEI